jgi:polyferredoxin
VPERIVTPRGPGADDGPRRFIRRWLSFDETRPVRARKAWMLAATVAILLVVTAVLSWLSTSSN